MRPDAATVRRILCALLAFFAFLCVSANAARADNSSTRHEIAKNQFDRAEKERQALEASPEAQRTLKDYASLVTAYRRVYLITPRAAEVPTALNQVAALYRAMGDLFDEKYYQLAVNTYQFLVREYPTSRYREDAMLAIGQIEQDDLHDPVLARKSYEEFLLLHPRSSHVAEVRAVLDQLRVGGADGQTGPKTSGVKQRPPATRAVQEKTSAPADTKQQALVENNATGGSKSQVTGVRTWNADTYTRIVIDVGAQVKYQAARISGPDRIYFDIENAKIDPDMLHKPIDVESGGFLKSVRVAQNQLGVVRVVLEVDRAKDYSVFLLPDPYRLVVDVYGSSAAAEEAARSNAPAPGPTKDAPSVNPAKTAAEPASKTQAKGQEKTPANSAAASAANIEVTQNGKRKTQPSSSVPQPREAVASKSTDTAALKPAVAPSAKIPVTQAAKNVESASLPPAETEMNSDAPPLAPRPASGKVKSLRNTKSAHDQAEEMGPPSIPEPTRNGQPSLSRALGLKIGRIVIDAGHGGHDTGTIGPTGLMEKDLCLDVALRVGKLIQQRLPSAEVIYTREDDTFVPLEHRTEIANDARADLFLSVHANSSPDHKARGIETYYLNFTGSSDAMEVATRENALSENGVHDLQDIVKKIARNEKIEESRDLAGSIQDSLAKRVENINRGDRNRGVRKAPFVVLIGANMPSVLAEISFISNPSDEQWLKKPENRQRVAEGLYRGVETYLHSTNSLTLNQAHAIPGNRAGIVARSGNPQ